MKTTMAQLLECLSEFPTCSHIDIDRLRSLMVLYGYCDEYTVLHQIAVAKLGNQVGTILNLASEDMATLYAACLVHDIGKIGIPNELLLKPYELNKAELDLLRYHVELSAEILRNIRIEKEIVEVVAQHHERIDGSGYPKHLAEINFLSQILAICDVVDSMVTERPYRKALPFQLVEKELLNGKYNVQVAQIALDLVRK